MLKYACAHIYHYENRGDKGGIRMDESSQKIWACLLSILMVVSTLAIVGNTTAKQPDDTPGVDIESGTPDVQVTELRAETPVVYIDQNNRLVLSVSNQGNATALKVTANVTDIVPKQSEELISTEHFGTLKPGMEKTRFIDWIPTTRGIHYIKVEIKCEYLTHNSPAEMVESEPIVLSAGFPVSPQATVKLAWGPGGWPVYDDNNTINLTTEQSGIREVSGTSSDPVEITVYEGLTIEAPCTLKLNEYVTFVIENPNEPGEYGINIEVGSQFIINNPSKTTTIMTPNNEFKYNTYPFLNSGTVDFLGASVLYTYGPSDLALAGGIQNMEGSMCIIDDCNLLEADTHTLYINGTADVQTGDYQVRSDSVALASSEAPVRLQLMIRDLVP